MIPVEKLAGGVVLGIGAATSGIAVWAARKILSLGRPPDLGDAVVLSVLTLFAAFCLYMGWRLFRSPASAEAAPDAPKEPSRRRVTLSGGFATAGVVLLMLSALLPEDWYPAIGLFLGIAFLCVSHALTPCVERVEQLRRAQSSMRQL